MTELALRAVDGIPPVQGRYDPRFRPIVDAFLGNYETGEEVGSAVSVIVDGRKVIDIWGGWTDANRSIAWSEDTLVCMMSVAKGITAITFAMLIDRGLIDIDAPVANYWPEFAANGKEGVLVRHVLDHTAGLPVLTDKRLWPGALLDREAMVSALEIQHPLWEPGTVAAYHVHTQGFILGEIMRRVAGSTVGPFLRDNIKGPLGVDYAIGLPDVEHGRCARLMPHPGLKLMAAKTAEPETNLRPLAFYQNPPGSWEEMLNSAEWRRCEMASGNGHGNARAVARIYGTLARGGTMDGVTLMRPETIQLMASLQHDQIELLQERHYRQGLGVLLNSPGAVYMGPNPEAFGHHGIGGSIGFADPVAKIGFSYACNQMHAVGDNGPRARALIDALYGALL